MFQTELIEFLQSFSTDWLTGFLLFVTQLGYASFYIPVLILITFGLDFRRGFLLIQLIVWVGLVTGLLKNLFGLPRPVDVDSGVKRLADNVPNQTPFTDMGGRGFWRLPDREAIELFRAQPEWSFGFPSGHVSGTTAFWGGLALLFRPTAWKVAAPVMVVLMALSRMYLGRHFLADVLGGFFLALGFLVAAHILLVRPETHGRLLDLVRLRLALDGRSALLLAVLLLAPVAFLPWVEVEMAGRLFGLNAAFVMLALAGLPDDAAAWFKRAGRVVLAFALYVAASWLVGLLIGTGDQNSRWIEFLAAAAPAFVALWGGVKAGLGAGLYSRKVETA